MAKELEKTRMFFRPYLKSSIDEFKKQGINSSLCQEILSDNIPCDNDFILSYFKIFPERLDAHVFDIIVDTELKMILHDVIVRHACEYVSGELEG